MALFVIEHLDPEVFDWNFLEYRAISELIGKERTLFTNVRRKSDAARFAKLGAVDQRTIVGFWRELPKPCLLDPNAAKTLTPAEAREFGAFIFGGILGNDPPQTRTRDLLTVKMEGIPVRNLGPKQFSTDTAVRVVHMLFSGTPLERMRFQDGIEVPLRKGEDVFLPYRYLTENGVPLLPRGLVQMLRKREEF